MKDGAILANAGHFNVEIDVEALEKAKVQKTKVRRNLDEYLLEDGRKIYLVGEGRIANLVAAEGHPPEVMSLSFSNQLLSAVYITRHENKMEKRVNNVPTEIDRQVAVTALEAMGIKIDTLTEEQNKYASSWVV
jgi:adenosylhomocysteinase